MQLQELLIDAPRQVTKDIVRLLRRRPIGAGHHAGERRQLGVQAAGEIQLILLHTRPALDELLLDSRQLRLDPCRGAAHCLRRLPGEHTFGAVPPVLHLLSDTAQPVNGIVGLRELVANAQEEVELRVEIGLGCSDTRILAQCERGRIGLCSQAELDLIGARRCQRPGQTTLGRGISGNATRIGVAQVPDEAIHPLRGRHTRLFRCGRRRRVAHRLWKTA